MAEIKWIKICTDIFDNKKIKQIEVLPEGDTIIVIWFKLIVLAGSINDNGQVYFTPEIPFTDQMLATQFGRPLNVVQMALNVFEKFEMIEVINDIICLPSWEKYQNIEGMERIREQNRLRKQRQREREKLALLEHKEEERDTSRDITQQNKNKNKNIYSASAEAQELFERLWKLYPRKKGKTSVSATKKKELLKVGEEKLVKAIERYSKEVEGKDEQYVLMGSTFFNGRYTDYLEEPEVKKNKYGY